MIFLFPVTNIRDIVFYGEIFKTKKEVVMKKLYIIALFLIAPEALYGSQMRRRRSLDNRYTDTRHFDYRYTDTAHRFDYRFTDTIAEARKTATVKQMKLSKKAIQAGLKGRAGELGQEVEKYL